MTITTAILTTAFILTWAIILTGWFAPFVFRLLGVCLYSFGEAMEDVRDTFKLRLAGWKVRGLVK